MENLAALMKPAGRRADIQGVLLPSVIGGPAGGLGFSAMVTRIPWESSCPLRRQRRSMSLAAGGPLWGAERTTFAHREPFRF